MNKVTIITTATTAARGHCCPDLTVSTIKIGKVGGFAHLATLIKQLRGSAKGSLLLDGGDTWQGSGTAL